MKVTNEAAPRVLPVTRVAEDGATYYGPFPRVRALARTVSGRGVAGINEAKDLCQGETLCGACQDACPINIDIPRMLLALRAKLAEGDASWNVRVKSRAERAATTAASPRNTGPHMRSIPGPPP